MTISYNQAEFLERAILSVIQSDVDLEYIVVDPGSSDGSREIIERYRSSIHKIIYDPDDGPADGLNRGLAAATGDIFAYINADDAFADGALAEAVDAMRKYPDADIVYGNGFFVDEDDRKLTHLISHSPIVPALYARGVGFILQQASFARIEVLREIGGFNVANRTSWDGDAFLEIAKRGGAFQRVWRDWGIFRLHGQSMTGSGKAHQRYLEDVERAFYRYFGRPRNPLDKAIAIVARPAMLLLDRRRLYARISGDMRRLR